MRTLGLAALCLTGLILNGLVIGPVALTSAINGHNDFRHFYTGAMLAGNTDLYDGNRVSRMQERLFGEPNRRVVPNRLPVYYSLISPLAWWPYRTAYALWIGLLTGAVLLFVRLLPSRHRGAIAIACCWSLPLIFSIMIGQDIVFLLLAIAASLLAFQKGRLFLSGALLSLCLIKYNLILLMPLLLIQKRQWRAGVGFLTGAASFLIASCLIAWGWIKPYLASIFDPQSNPMARDMSNIYGLSQSFSNPLVAEGLLCALTVLISGVLIHRTTFPTAFAGALAGSFLLSRHASVQDCAILIPALLTFALVPVSLVRAVAVMLLLPVPYIFVLIGFPQVASVSVLCLLAIAAVYYQPNMQNN